jgi:hypothetical protein
MHHIGMHLKALMWTVAQAVVEPAVHALVQRAIRPVSTPGTALLQQLTDAQDRVLVALATAGPSTAAPLVDGLLRLFEARVAQSAQQDAAAPSWRAHPLSRALLSSNAAAQPLVLGVARLLARAAAQPQQAASARILPAAAPWEKVLAALRPFISIVLLEPKLAARLPLLPGQSHATLARIASCVPSAAAQLDLLALLVAYLPAMRLGSDGPTAAGSPAATAQPQGAAPVAQAVADVMEVLQSCDEEPGEAATFLLHLAQAAFGSSSFACVTWYTGNRWLNCWASVCLSLCWLAIVSVLEISAILPTQMST